MTLDNRARMPPSRPRRRRWWRPTPRSRTREGHVQVHGGIGFTWEHDAHLHLKRAHVLDQILGSRRHHLAALLRQPAAQ